MNPSLLTPLSQNQNNDIHRTHSRTTHRMTTKNSCSHTPTGLLRKRRALRVFPRPKSRRCQVLNQGSRAQLPEFAFPRSCGCRFRTTWRRTTDRAGGIGCRRGGGRILSGVQCPPSKCSADAKNQKQRKEQDCRKLEGRLEDQVAAQVKDDTPRR